MARITEKTSHKGKSKGHIHNDPKLIQQSDKFSDLPIGKFVYLDKDSKSYKLALSTTDQRKSWVQGLVWSHIGDPTDKSKFSKFYLRVAPGPMSYRFPLTKDYFNTDGSVNNTVIPGQFGDILWLSETDPGGMQTNKPISTHLRLIIGYKTNYGFLYQPKYIECCGDPPPPPPPPSSSSDSSSESSSSDSSSSDSSSSNSSSSDSSSSDSSSSDESSSSGLSSSSIHIPSSSSSGSSDSSSNDLSSSSDQSSSSGDQSSSSSTPPPPSSSSSEPCCLFRFTAIWDFDSCEWIVGLDQKSEGACGSGNPTGWTGGCPNAVQYIERVCSDNTLPAAPTDICSNCSSSSSNESSSSQNSSSSTNTDCIYIIQTTYDPCTETWSPSTGTPTPMTTYNCNNVVGPRDWYYFGCTATKRIKSGDDCNGGCVTPAWELPPGPPPDCNCSSSSSSSTNDSSSSSEPTYDYVCIWRLDGFWSCVTHSWYVTNSGSPLSCQPTVDFELPPAGWIFDDDCNIHSLVPKFTNVACDAGCWPAPQVGDENVQPLPGNRDDYCCSSSSSSSQSSSYTSPYFVTGMSVLPFDVEF